MKGIINIGNSCYLNSALQMLFNSEDFRNILKNKVFIGTLFENIIKNYDNSNIFNPGEVKRIVANNNKIFANCNQQDSYEFIIYLFDVLDKNLCNSMNNVLYDKFGIETTSNIKCKMANCGKESENKSTELFLQLPITDELDLSDSYRKYKSVGKLENDKIHQSN
jgi:ubiquitin carboxyl-terminal hydrolase 5/13